MSAYRVKVEAYVVVEARNLTDAKAKAETAVRGAVSHSYVEGFSQYWADAWERFGFQAIGKPERIPDDE